MTGTVAFDIKDALKVLLDNDVTLNAMDPKPQIDYGFDGKASEMPRFSIQIGEIFWEDESSTALGAHRRDEKFNMAILIQSHGPGDSQKEANDRVEAAMQAIEMIVRDERWSGITGVYGSGIVPQYLMEGTDAEGRASILLLRLVISARI